MNSKSTRAFILGAKRIARNRWIAGNRLYALSFGGLPNRLLAKKLGVSLYLVTQWERGEFSMKFHHAVAIAELLDVSLWEVHYEGQRALELHFAVANMVAMHDKSI